VPGIGVLMPWFGLPPVRLAGRATGEALRRLGTALGRDVEEVLRVFDALPDGQARHAILRTLRSAVDWRGQAITMLDRAYLAEGIPTLIVWGGHDAIIPVGHAHKAHDVIGGSRLEIFDEAGHFPHHQDPARFVEVVRGFVASTAAAQFDPGPWRERLRAGGRRSEPELTAWPPIFLDTPVSSAS